MTVTVTPDAEPRYALTSGSDDPTLIPRLVLGFCTPGGGLSTGRALAQETHTSAGVRLPSQFRSCFAVSVAGRPAPGISEWTLVG
jgi:hypothetical protein